MGTTLQRIHRLLVTTLGVLAAAVCGSASGQDPPPLNAALALEQAVVDAIAAAERSVVAIARFRTDEPSAAGLGEMLNRPLPAGPLAAWGDRIQVPDEFAAGVVIDRQGYVVTNFHVLGDPARNRYVVMAGRRPFDVVDVVKVEEVKAGDPWTDLAVIKIEADDLEPITFGDARQLRKGQFVISLGNPYNIARNGEVSASWGIISNLGRRIPRDESPTGMPPPKERLYHYGGLIQTDARLNMGTSGGALINLRGEMIGLTTAMASLEGFEKSLGFAIPVDESFRATVETLKSGRKAEFGFLGVAPRDLSEAMQRNNQYGVEIAQVVPSTPADEAGLREGDIITRVNDVPVYDSQNLMCELGKLPAGAKIRLSVQRGTELGQRGRVFLTSATLSKKYIPLSDQAFAQVPEPRWRGMSVDFATAALPPHQLQLAMQTGAPAGSLAALDVQRESPAWKAGLRPGNLFTHVDGQRVTTPDQFHEVVRQLTGDVKVRVVSANLGDVTVPAQ